MFFYYLNIIKEFLWDLHDTNNVNNDNNNTNTVIKKEKYKIGLLTNEIPPIIYGGVATWIVNFMKMFEDNEIYEVIPIFLAHQDTLPQEVYEKYPNIRVINSKCSMKEIFVDIDICVNNLWVALDYICHLRYIYPQINIVTVCHSLIRMENITNMGSCYTNNFNEQEITFKNSDYVILISDAEKVHYDNFHYNQFSAITRRIYNPYQPKYDNTYFDVDYFSNVIGYIGRHVPRKQPELALMSVVKHNIKNTSVINMGVDNDRYENLYWNTLEKIYEKILTIIPFTSDKSVKESYFKQIGANVHSAIYEPLGYVPLECLDRRIPLIVADIDGPKEIIKNYEKYVYPYTVNISDYEKNIDNCSIQIKKFLNTSPEIRKLNCEKARDALDKFRPENIVKEWIQLFNEIVNIH
tara:strand:+ start:62 stop:1288 length:1227 start_codon:yes stop_codon:yes gene_type:complete